jgi:DNA polymerase-3 subunit delta
MLHGSPQERGLNYDPVDGTGENISNALERANTFSFMSGRKVVAFLDSGMFYSKENEKSLLEKAKEAYEERNMKKAARYFSSFMSIKKLSFEDIGKENRAGSIDADGTDSRWMDDVAAYCIGNNISVSGSEDNAAFFQKAVEKGFPRGNHLIVTAELVDKKLVLYKSVDKNGVIIDCQIPKGDSRKDKDLREKVLAERMDAVLLKNQKKIDKEAFHALSGKTGFDLRSFLNNLEKLINYTGQRNRITVEDVESVVKRTKLDPIYELTNAVSERDLSDSLFYLDSILDSEIHPLQALSAIINQFRKIIWIKGFIESSYGKAWEPGSSYPRFTSVVLPAMEEYDDGLLKNIEDWGDFTEESGKKASKKKSKTASDIFLSKSAKNPFALFQIARKSEKFNKEELISIFESLKDADLELKSSGRNPKLVIENVILHICRQKKIPA